MMTIDVIYAPTTRQISLPDDSDFYAGATIDSNSVEIAVTGIDATNFTPDLMVRIDFAVNLLVCGNKTVRPFLILEHVDDAWRGVIPVDVLRGAAKLKKLPFQLVLRDGDITINSRNTLTLGVNRAIDAMGTLWKVYYPYIMLRDDSWAWLPNFTYTVGSVVTYEGHMYVSKVDENRGNAPILPDDPTQSDDPFWKINIGPPGPQGPPGELVDGGDMVVRYIGDDVNTTYVVPHNLGTSKLIYSMQKDGKFIDASVSANPDDPNSLIVSFTEPPGFNKVIMTIYSGYATKVYDVLPEEGEYQGELIYYTPDKTIRYWADDTWLILLQKRYFDIHLGDHNNPHHVTKAQVGLDQVDNTSDEDKPLSRASREAFAKEKEEREEADERLRFDLNAEIQARTEADDLLGVRIDNEARERAEADTAIQNRLSQEIQDRKDADAALQKAIDDEVARSTSKDAEHDQAIAKEIQDRKDADAALQTAIDNEAAARVAGDEALQTAIDNEAAARIAGDEALQNAIDTEIERSIAKDEELERLIGEEASARQAADEALTQALATETSERKAQDAILQGLIEDEVEARIIEIRTVHQRIDEETTERKAQDIALQKNIDAEAQARQTADQALDDKKVNRAGDTMTGTLILAQPGHDALHIANASRDMVEGTESYFSAIHFKDGGTSSRPPADCSMLASSSVKDVTTGVVRTDTYLYSMNTNKATDSPSNAALHLIANDDGTAWATAPTTPSTATGDEIATAGWVLSVMDPSSPEWMDELDNKVNKTGDTMTGRLTMSGAPTVYAFNGSDVTPISFTNELNGNTSMSFMTAGLRTSMIRSINADNSKHINLMVFGSEGNFSSYGTLSCSYNVTDNVYYATAPSPASKSDSSSKIATTSWVNQSDFLVHTYGAETIDGSKTFISPAFFKNYKAIRIQDTDMTVGVNPKSALVKRITWTDSTDKDMGIIEWKQSSTGELGLGFNLDNGTHSTWQFGFKLYPDGTAKAIAPTTPSYATSNEIATADWVIAKNTALQTNIDGKVSKSGDTMTGDLRITGSTPRWIRIQRTDLNRDLDAIFPDSGTVYYGGMIVTDTNDAPLFGYNRSITSDRVTLTLQNSQKVNGSLMHSSLNLIIMNDGTTFASAPTPSSKQDNSTKIATTAWVNQSNFLVHTTGAETIDGTKTFTSKLYINDSTGDGAIEMTGKWPYIDMHRDYDTANDYTARIWNSDDGGLVIKVKNVKTGLESQLGLVSNSNSVRYATAPSPPTDATSNEIATADWVINKLTAGVTGMATVKRGTITGDGTTTAFTFQHDIASSPVTVQVYRNNVLIVTDVTLSSLKATVTFGDAPAQGEVFDIVVVG